MGFGTRPVRKTQDDWSAPEVRDPGDRGARDAYLAEVVGEEKGLEEGVHVASGALVLESNVASRLLRVVAVGGRASARRGGLGH